MLCNKCKVINHYFALKAEDIQEDELQEFITCLRKYEQETRRLRQGLEAELRRRKAPSISMNFTTTLNNSHA
jgi:hypothetical protein